MKRREFLAATAAGVGWVVVSACVGPRAGRGGRSIGKPRGFEFPQGLASADPSPDSVVLWTRVVSKQESAAAIPVTLQVSAAEHFEEVVAEEAIEATAENDFTLRVIVEDLQPDTTYYYRFLVGDGASQHGRTRTAPGVTDPRDIRFAFVSCQNYEQGYYGGYRRMLRDDVDAPEAEQLDFVLHLGDFIYEIIGMPSASEEGGSAPRSVPPFPSGGGGEWLGMRYAASLDDYRHLYRTYLSDPDLQAARARWPFVCTWDDHEFTNDSWQSRSTYQAPDQPAQRRKLAANQAWFEFVPARLSGSNGVLSVLQRAHDFRPTSVVDAPFEGIDSHGFNREPNNRAAVESLTIYRSLRFGQHAELVLTDTRSYRSDHAIPEEVALEHFGSSKMVPTSVVKICDAGRSHARGKPPRTLMGRHGEFPNPRRKTPSGTILGKLQKRWFKQTLHESTATWKLWGNSVPLMPIRFDMQSLDPEQRELILSPDTWDGYGRERGELMRYIAKRKIRNFVSLTGDNHMNFAGQVMVDFDAAKLKPIGAEFAIAGISSTSMFGLLTLMAGEDFAPFVRYDSRPFGGDEERIELLNMTLLDGTKAALATGESGDRELGKELSNPDHARHLRYMDANGYGYGLAKVSADGLDIRYVGIPAPVKKPGRKGSPVLRSVSFRVPSSVGDAPPVLEGPFFDEGDPPFPFG